MPINLTNSLVAEINVENEEVVPVTSFEFDDNDMYN